MFKRVFGKAKQEANALPTIHKLNDVWFWVCRCCQGCAGIFRKFYESEFCVEIIVIWVFVFLLKVLFFGIVQTLEMLEKKEKVLVKKAAAEVEKAKQFTQARNRTGKTPYRLHVVYLVFFLFLFSFWWNYIIWIYVLYRIRKELFFFFLFDFVGFLRMMLGCCMVCHLWWKDM